MPNYDSGNPINQQPIEKRPNARPFNSPTPPDNPHSPTAEGISHQDVQSEVKDIEDRVKRAERWMIGLTGGIAFFALCAVIVGILQWSAMNGQLKEMQGGSRDTHTLAQAADIQAKKMTDVSAAADKIRQAAENMVTQDQRIADNAEKSLNASNAQSKRALDESIAASQRALDASILTSQLDERPWVVISSFRLSQEPELNKGVTATIGVINTGKTPAIDVIPLTAMSSWPPEPPAQDFPKPSGPTNRGVLPPASPAAVGNFNITPDPPLVLDTEAELSAYNNGPNNLYIQGKFWYTDIFHRQHWTTFCIFHPHGRPLESFNYCVVGNDVDRPEQGGKAN